jgi:hypothetical protein
MAFLPGMWGLMGRLIPDIGKRDWDELAVEYNT